MILQIHVVCGFVFTLYSQKLVVVSEHDDNDCAKEKETTVGDIVEKHEIGESNNNTNIMGECCGGNISNRSVEVVEGCVKKEIVVDIATPVKRCREGENAVEGESPFKRRFVVNSSEKKEKTSVKCNQSQFESNTASELKAHMRADHEENKCDQCEFEGKNYRGLKTHIRTKHMRNKCDQCEYEAKNVRRAHESQT